MTIVRHSMGEKYLPFEGLEVPVVRHDAVVDFLVSSVCVGWECTNSERAKCQVTFQNSSCCGFSLNWFSQGFRLVLSFGRVQWIHKSNNWISVPNIVWIPPKWFKLMNSIRKLFGNHHIHWWLNFLGLRLELKDPHHRRWKNLWARSKAIIFRTICNVLFCVHICQEELFQILCRFEKSNNRADRPKRHRWKLLKRIFRQGRSIARGPCGRFFWMAWWSHH